jgi:afadin
MYVGFSSMGESLPARLEFKDDAEDQLLAAVITNVNGANVQFKLAPTYTLYMAMRHRVAVVESSPNVTPQNKDSWIGTLAIKMAQLMHHAIQGQGENAAGLSFWMANASELLHFLKQDRVVCLHSVPARVSCIPFILY